MSTPADVAAVAAALCRTLDATWAAEQRLIDELRDAIAALAADTERHRAYMRQTWRALDQWGSEAPMARTEPCGDSDRGVNDAKHQRCISEQVPARE